MNLICGYVNKIRWSCKSDVFGVATIIQNSGTSSQCAKICFVSLVVSRLIVAIYGQWMVAI